MYAAFMAKKTDKKPADDPKAGDDKGGRQPFQGVALIKTVKADLRLMQRKHPDPLEKGPPPGIATMIPPGG